MTKEEYKKYFELAKKITKGDERTYDLLHDTLIQLSQNNKYLELSEQEKKFFFIRSIQNQFYSNSSQFQRKYKRFSFVELQETLEIPETNYEEPITMEWINETLEKELELNPDFWYNKGIFDLWCKHKGFIERVHKQTQIPRYSIKDTVKEVRELLKKRWRQNKDGKN